MLKIKKTSISITRGDSAYISFSLSDLEGNPLVLEDGDRVRCQVRMRPIDGELLFDGVITEAPNGEMIWHIYPEDTASLDVGDYYWDAQVEYSNGDIFTFVDVSDFTILPEVTLGRG